MILRDGFAVVDPGESREAAVAMGGTVRVTIDARSGWPMRLHRRAPVAVSASGAPVAVSASVAPAVSASLGDRWNVARSR